MSPSDSALSRQRAYTLLEAIMSPNSPLGSFTAFEWLLDDAIFQGRGRAVRRRAYRNLTKKLSREFKRVWMERLTASNAPGNSEDVFDFERRSRACIAQMSYVAWRHFLRLPVKRQQDGILKSLEALTSRLS